ncbi:MAG: type III restriction-modification system endonuclease [Segatella copri]
MKLKFKIQQYQTDAVESVINVFKGQPNQANLEYRMDKGKLYVVDSKKHDIKFVQTDVFADSDDAGNSLGYKNNRLAMDKVALFDNIRQIQTENNIHQDEELCQKLGACQLDVEMETGTGKTYVYIKTMFELNKQYGWTKFIVVVPSIAIREGVKKSFDITVDHFMEQYGKKARYFIYDSSSLNDIDTFSQSNDISVMIINTQAFNTMKEGAKNKAARIINSERDEFGSRKPIAVLAANNPIIILDEPQKMGGAATQTALKAFNPLFTLNYSATHKEHHNTVYVLDALDAYNHKLVKKIEVVGFELKNLKGTDSYIYFAELLLSKDKAPQVRLEIEQQSTTGAIKRIYKKLGEGDDLYSASGNMLQYKGFMITDIVVDAHQPSRSQVKFSNGESLMLKEVIGNVTADHKARIQIRETIKAHFRKESALFHRGIKCLSLFFIDEVAKYRQYDEDGNALLGRYGEIFEQEYRAELLENQNMYDPEYMQYLSCIPVNKTHEGYFSIDPKTKRIKDSDEKKGAGSDDVSAYDLIMKDKERLLSLDPTYSPVRFIFSHSALREGWDNPNIFQICSLRQANSISQKRQEVGRGLRLCVDNKGVRQDADTLQGQVQQINRLTVIASEGYADFVNDLQKNISEDLYDRPKVADIDYFDGKTFTIEDGSKHSITTSEAKKIYFYLVKNGYVDDESHVTDAYRSAATSGTLAPLPDEVKPYGKWIHKLIEGVWNPSALDGMIENGSTPQTPENRLNENFTKKEFQELWNRINHKYAYTVNFESKELIEKAIAAINKELVVSKLSYVVTRGVQKTELKHDDMKAGSMMVQEEMQHDDLRTDVVSTVKYDLLGKIAANTRLTRKTIAGILSQIMPSKFDMYKMNPEEFIRRVSRLILEQKATIIVDHISYNEIEGSYDSAIFTEEKHTSLDKAYQGRKSIVDYVFTDGTAKQSVERKFVEDLDTSTDVAVYAKLPKGFHIPTPVGNYSPDWAIAFKDGAVKHVYFVAETKGSMSTLDLRGIEDGKIACADRLFEQLSGSGIYYHKVTNYDDLMEWVK